MINSSNTTNCDSYDADFESGPVPAAARGHAAVSYFPV
jgi:hypothetical protein